MKEKQERLHCEVAIMGFALCFSYTEQTDTFSSDSDCVTSHQYGDTNRKKIPSGLLRVYINLISKKENYSL